MTHSWIRPRPTIVAPLLGLLFTLGGGVTGRADLILFNASVDSSAEAVSNPGQSVPGDTAHGGSNQYIPAISPGVSINAGSGTPGFAYLDGFTAFATYTLGANSYGPFGPGGNAAGSTQAVLTMNGQPTFDNVQYTFSAAGKYQLTFEVANVGSASLPSALAIDTSYLIPSGGSPTPLFSFGSGLPAGFTMASGSTFGTTDGPTSGLNPPSGGTFGYIDNTGTATAQYDTVDTVDVSSNSYGASRLYSGVFSVTANEKLSLNLVFLTSDGSANTADYAVVGLTAVPEPSGLARVASALASGAVLLWLQRLGRRRAMAR